MATRVTTEGDLERAMEIHAKIFHAIEAKEPGYAQTTVDDVILSLECKNGGTGNYHGGPVGGGGLDFQDMLITACANHEGRATAGVFPRDRIEYLIENLRSYDRDKEPEDADTLQRYLGAHTDHFA